MQGVHTDTDTYKVALIKPASSGAHGAATTTTVKRDYVEIPQPCRLSSDQRRHFNSSEV